MRKVYQETFFNYNNNGLGFQWNADNIPVDADTLITFSGPVPFDPLGSTTGLLPFMDWVQQYWTQAQIQQIDCNGALTLQGGTPGFEIEVRKFEILLVDDQFGVIFTPISGINLDSIFLPDPGLLRLWYKISGRIAKLDPIGTAPVIGDNSNYWLGFTTRVTYTLP
jgi:hypothetical protein